MSHQHTQHRATVGMSAAVGLCSWYVHILLGRRRERADRKGFDMRREGFIYIKQEEEKKRR